MTSLAGRAVAVAEGWRRRNATRLRIFGAVLSALIGLWFAGWLLAGDSLLPIRWGAYGAPFLAVLAMVAAAALLCGRKPVWAAAAAILGILILVPVWPRLSPARWGGAAQPYDLRVMTFNVSSLNAEYGRIADLIVRERPDVVFLQQTRDLHALRIAIQARHGAYRSYPDGNSDTVILSRLPLSRGRQFAWMTSGVASIGRCRVNLFDLHAPHGQYDAGGQELFFENAARAVADSASPVIAGGDLNSTEFNLVQLPLRAQVSDAFARAGFGFGFTFPSHVRRFGTFGPLLRIDHIFFRGLSVANAWVLGDSANSDHFPVEATFRLDGACH